MIVVESKRAAVLGSSAEIDYSPLMVNEMEFVAEFLLKNGYREISTGGGGGVPRRFTSLFLDKGGEVFTYSPWSSREECLKQHPGWVQDPRANVVCVGGGEDGDFDTRDHYTLKDCDLLLVLPWGVIGAGTAREVMSALRKSVDRNIVFLCSRLTPEQGRTRILHVFLTAQLFKDDRGSRLVELCDVDLLAHRPVGISGPHPRPLSHPPPPDRERGAPSRPTS
jgi:predicted Rossmann-fold nucleotide-binding protein